MFEAAGPSFHQWLNYRTKATQFGDNKNTPSGKFDPKPVVLEAPQVDEPATTPREPTTGDFSDDPENEHRNAMVNDES